MGSFASLAPSLAFHHFFARIEMFLSSTGSLLLITLSDGDHVLRRYLLILSSAFFTVIVEGFVSVVTAV